jgi:HEAT repeat protein
LLASESDVALRNYLSLVAHNATRDEALAIVREVSAPVVGQLFALLEDEDKTVRLGAALVLGKVNGAEVTRSLIARVTARPAGSTEAWIALLACRGELAEDFFAYATQRPQLLGYVNGARLQWAQLVH